MQTLIERGCGLDVHQATVVACLLMVRRDGKVQKQMRTFGTTTRSWWVCANGCSLKAAPHGRLGLRGFIRLPPVASWNPPSTY